MIIQIDNTDWNWIKFFQWQAVQEQWSLLPDWSQPTETLGLNNSKMASNTKLTYFDMRGRKEQIQNKDWPALKPSKAKIVRLTLHFSSL